MNENTETHCANCGDKLDQEFWTVTRCVWSPAKAICVHCKKIIELEYSASMAMYRITKECSCPFEMTEILLEAIRGRNPWTKKTYYFCGKCFQDYPIKNIAMTEVLGEAQKEQ